MTVIDSRSAGILSVLASENTGNPTDQVRAYISSVTDIPLKFVRTRSRQMPGTRPDLSTNWASVAIEKFEVIGSPNVVGKKGIISNPTSGKATVETHQRFRYSALFYGADALSNAEFFRESFSLTQNIDCLKNAGLQFVSVDESVSHLPDFAFEQFCDRYEVKFVIGRKSIRHYGVRDFASAKDFSLITERQE